MRNLLLLSLWLGASAMMLAQTPAAAAKPQTAQQAPAKPQPTTPAQTPAKPQPAPATTAPAQPAKPATPAATTPRPAPAALAARGGLAITITNSSGAAIPGIHVSLTGLSERSGESNASGQLNFPGLQAGTYRLRFTGDEVTAFEKEVSFRAGQVLGVDVMLNPAPPRPPAPAPVAPPPPPPSSAVPASGPTGKPQSMSVPKVLEGEYIGKEPRRESLLACSGTTRTTMLQINQPLPERMYAAADVVYYVIGGEGTFRLNGKDQKLSVNDFVSVPRGGSHSFERKGTRPLILLSVLGGETCDPAK